MRRGSSWPVIVQTAGGVFITKLRGAAQGVPPLIAEIIVAELATTLGLSVPERTIVTFEEGLPSDDRNDELADLLGRSIGPNLGFRFLKGATDLGPNDLGRIDREFAARVLWLDGLAMNPDRTARNPNILVWNRQPWLIDHGAALGFHYDWADVSEATPREPRFDLSTHLFGVHAHEAADLDAGLAALVSRDALALAAGHVPDDFLETAFPSTPPVRTRAAYVAFLWKRLKAPRPFVVPS